jgi:putative flippase GtrA
VVYLLVGGWNSVVAYASFFLLYFLIGDRLPPSVVLAIAYLLASVNGYLTFRYFVFKPVRHPLIEYVRYQAVYLPLLGINLVFLPVAMTVTHLNAYVVQVCFGIFAVVFGYVGNKYFAFRKRDRD